MPTTLIRLFRKNPIVIEAITFDDFVQYGIENGGNVHNGVPWSFNFKGVPVSHENDECYLVSARNGIGPMKFNRGEMLVCDENDNVFPMKRDTFEMLYEEIE